MDKNGPVPTDETAGVSLFASRDDSGTKMTAILLNLDPDAPVTADVDVSRCGALAAKRVFSYSGNAPAIVEYVAGKDPKTVSERLPQYSITVLDLTFTKPISH